MEGRIPGFKYDRRKRQARFEVIVPGTGSGRRRRKTVRGVTRDQALNQWKQFREEVLGNRASEEMTLEAYVETVWPQTKLHAGARTAAHDEWILIKVLMPRVGGVQLQAIGDARVRDLVAELRRDGYAPATVNGVTSVLRKVLRDAWSREILAAVPVRKFPREREERLRLEMSTEEQNRFLAAFDDFHGFQKLIEETRKMPAPKASRFFRVPRRFGGGLRADGVGAQFWFERFRWSRPILIVALETGLTRCDLLGLQWSNIDTKARFIRMARQKTHKEALIPISKACAEALEECRKRAIVASHVFLTQDGKAYSVTTILRHFGLAKRLAGIHRRLRFHDLRHTFASRLASRGVPMQFIAKALGQSSIGMAERYGRANDEALEYVRRALDAPQAQTPEARTGSPEK